MNPLPRRRNGAKGGAAPENASAARAGASLDLELLPPLGRDLSFWSITVTQFLGAFNDNVYKQLVLLLTVSLAATDQAVASDQQWVAMLVFSAPFLMFSGVAGLLSERFSKRTVIVLSKAAEIVVMSAALLALATVARHRFHPVLYVVLFFMGAQSTFFGPGKYGILPEKLRDRDLPRANGIILMTTFLAIIFGTVLAGALKFSFRDQLWMGALVCVAIAAAGFITSLGIRRVPPASPDIRFSWGCLGVPREVRGLLRSDRPLLAALLASCMFWFVGGIVLPAANSLGVNQFQVNETLTSLLPGGMGVGIAVGSVLAGWLSGGHVNFFVMRVGAVGIAASLFALALPGPNSGQLLGYGGSLGVLIVLGAFTGLFAVPLQVFLQSRPPAGLKGWTIAVMNQANWVAIILSALAYFAVDRTVRWLEWPTSGMFFFTGLAMLPVVVCYRPREEDRRPAEHASGRTALGAAAGGAGSQPRDQGHTVSEKG